MSATKSLKRGAAPPSPVNFLTPASQGDTPSSTTIVTGDSSPERANKRTRFDYDQQQAAVGSVAGSRSSLSSTQGGGGGGGQNGQGMGTGKGGAVWVHEKVAELERLYKECIISATLFLQYRTYAKACGLSSQPMPIHLSRRLEVAWTQYESLRSHVESYLLKCAKSASASSAESGPSPKPSAATSTLIPGLAPLPSIPTVPLTALNLLQVDPHSGRVGRVALDKLLAADPAKGLVGYEKGQVVFPGAPSDVAMPMDEIQADDMPIPPPLDQSGLEAMPISLPGVDYPGDGSAAPDLDLNSLGIDELSALINGVVDDADGGQAAAGGFDPAGALGAEWLSAPPEPQQSVPQPSQPISTGDQFATVPPPQNQSSQSLLPPLSQQGPPQQPLPQSQSQNAQPQAQSSTATTLPAPNFDFGFPSLDSGDNMDPDSLADIDFDGLAGMFTNATSGRSTRAPTPNAAAPVPMSLSIPPSNPAALPTQPIAQPGSDQLGLSNMYSSTTVPAGGGGEMAEFDSSLGGGIDMSEFNFMGDGEGSMPGVDGDEFESMFAEFK